MRRDVAREIAHCCHQLAQSGLIAGQDGNVSVRLGDDRALVTPAGLIKGDITPDDMVEVDLSGKRIRGHLRPSSEIDMHLRILRKRPDIGSVVHAHPPTATGFSVAGESFNACVLPELIFLVGWVPLVPYGTPGTAELGEQLEPYIKDYDALLLANHGAVTMGPTLQDARIRMESLEHAAKILLTARLLGRVVELDRASVERLEQMRRNRGTDTSYPGCPVPGTGAGE